MSENQGKEKRIIWYWNAFLVLHLGVISTILYQLFEMPVVLVLFGMETLAVVFLNWFIRKDVLKR